MPRRPKPPCRPLSVAELKVACSSCSLRELCLPVGFSDAEMRRLDGLVSKRISVPRGATLYEFDQPFVALYAIRTGVFKTRTTSDGGREQVTGFPMAGDLLGLDGLSTERHSCDAIALEDAQVCAIAYNQLEGLCRELPELQRSFHRIMSREIVRDHQQMTLVGGTRAEERVAGFLLNLSRRLEVRGFSPRSIMLRMSREEVGSYLGLKLETVSRCFSKFHEDGILDVQLRQVQILDVSALSQASRVVPA